MQFSEIIGQEEVKKHLTELVQHNRLSHALLFLGKEGSGALPLALAFAQYVVCEKVQGKNNEIVGTLSLFGDPQPLRRSPESFGPTSNLSEGVRSPSDQPPTSPKESGVLRTNLQPDSCGTCPSCLKSQQLVHPDIHFSYPTVTRKPGEKPIATDFIIEWREFIRLSPYGNLFDWIEQIKEKENSQGKITAAECNDIIRKLSLKSFESEYKILIMWMPEELDKEGAKLLKIIEEPPPNTLFILVAENEELVLPTIVSRCQLVKVPPLEIKDVEAALVSRNKTDGIIARQVASVSDGNYREALQLVQHTEEDWQSLLREWLNAMLKTGPVAQAKWVEDISRLGREKQKQFLRYFNHLLEQSIRLRVMEDDKGLMAAEKDFAERLNKIAGIEQQQAIIEEIDRASYYIERNANGKMLFHALTIKLYHIIQDKIVFLMD